MRLAELETALRALKLAMCDTPGGDAGADDCPRDAAGDAADAPLDAAPGTFPPPPPAHAPPDDMVAYYKALCAPGKPTSMIARDAVMSAVRAGDFKPLRRTLAACRIKADYVEYVYKKRWGVVDPECAVKAEIRKVHGRRKVGEGPDDIPAMYASHRYNVLIPPEVRAMFEDWTKAGRAWKDMTREDEAQWRRDNLDASNRLSDLAAFDVSMRALTEWANESTR
jgi:hypothetical protein